MSGPATAGEVSGPVGCGMGAGGLWSANSVVGPAAEIGSPWRPVPGKADGIV
jgi:hypothetical protein